MGTTTVQKVMIEDLQLEERGGCPLCGAGEHKTHLGFSVIPVVRCCSCGFLYSERLMADGALSEYYRGGFGSERHRQGQSINAKLNARVIERLLPIAVIHSFLDVGAGYGYLLQHLFSGHNIRGVGVELSEQEARYGQTELGLDIRNGPLSASGLSPGSFDLVACFEVIEHIADPSSFLEELLSYVKPGGYLLVMTDNFESEVARKLGAGFPKWIPHSHISHFGPKTLERLFADKGVSIVGRFSYTPWELWARHYYFTLRGKKLTPETSFDLSGVLESEMAGRFRLFHLRRLINRAWVRLTARRDLDGALMYLLGRRVS